MGVGTPGASHVLANVKSGVYDKLQVKPQFLAALKARADRCAAMRLTKTDTMETWVAREIGWLQCIACFMQLRSCQDMDPAPIHRLLQLLAENNQHRVICDDLMSNHTFLLKFDS